ncbi:MAG: hypothetical protein ACD_67C00107G0002 [uncultured bacterium]|nr:MAG: hypothetical protein ACD_67C00107G0002 [uncultured bacterium]
MFQAINIFPHFFFRKRNLEERKLAPDEDTVAKTSLFTRIYTSLLRLLTVATFQNSLTLITRFSPTYFMWCRRDAGCKMRNAENYNVDNNRVALYDFALANDGHISNGRKHMPQEVLCRKNDHAVPAELSLNFRFNDSTYRVKIEAGMVPTLASVPCKKCARTTRDLLKNLGIRIPADDQKVDVLDLVSKIPRNRRGSALDPQHVSFIKHVFILEIEDICAMTEVPSNSPLFKEIEEHIKVALTGLVTCNGCADDDYLEDQLKA